MLHQIVGCLKKVYKHINRLTIATFKRQLIQLFGIYLNIIIFINVLFFFFLISDTQKICDFHCFLYDYYYYMIVDGTILRTLCYICTQVP